MLLSTAGALLAACAGITVHKSAKEPHRMRSVVERKLSLRPFIKRVAKYGEE